MLGTNTKTEIYEEESYDNNKGNINVDVNSWFSGGSSSYEWESNKGNRKYYSNTETYTDDRGGSGTGMGGGAFGPECFMSEVNMFCPTSQKECKFFIQRKSEKIGDVKVESCSQGNNY